MIKFTTKKIIGHFWWHFNQSQNLKLKFFWILLIFGPTFYFWFISFLFWGLYIVYWHHVKFECLVLKSKKKPKKLSIIPDFMTKPNRFNLQIWNNWQFFWFFLAFQNYVFKFYMMSIDNIKPSQQKWNESKIKCWSENEQNSKKFQFQILTLIEVSSQMTNNFLPCKFYHSLSSFLCLICLKHLIYDKKTLWCELWDQN